MTVPGRASQGLRRGAGGVAERGAAAEMAGDLEASQVEELLCQALETELGGVRIYETAIRCAQDPKLRGEWKKYLEETRNHERILRGLFDRVGMNPGTETAGRRVVRYIGAALVKAMEMGLESNDRAQAEVIAAECVVLAETKDHFNWQLVGTIANRTAGALREGLRQAYEEVEDQEDEHLYHTRGWARELWFQGFGLPAQLPPPEERKEILTAARAAKAQRARKRAVASSGRREGTAEPTTFPRRALRKAQARI